MSTFTGEFFKEFSKYITASTNLYQDIISVNETVLRFANMQNAAITNKFIIGPFDSLRCRNRERNHRETDQHMKATSSSSLDNARELKAMVVKDNSEEENIEENVDDQSGDETDNH
ncbi:hypothetical protein OnM2_054059 [Erysiphe neolycopersici]|uniref:Uncharacterized protein n=1 Tax=Erysiphe neolycopersici TaxID=212602 RepID=A0A420HRJ4_9PEZI|nr:hypothetical protein OnM2_054059 [Erysiphe neolycopersici]